MNDAESTPESKRMAADEVAGIAERSVYEATPHPPTLTAGTPAPLPHQLSLVAVVVAIAAVGVVAARSHATSGDAPDSMNALNPNQVLVSKAAADTVALQTERVILESAARTLRTDGTIHYSPYNTINVSPRLVGKVRDVYVRVGDHVSEGQPLLILGSTDAANAVDTARDSDQQMALTQVALETARKQFSLGTPEVTAAESALYQAQESAAFNKRMLDLAREQSKIGGFTDKPLADAQSAVKQAQTQMAEDQKDLTLAQKQYDRSSKSFEIGVAAKQDVDAAEDTLGKAKDAVSNDQEQLRIAQVTLSREQQAYNTQLYANQALRQSETNYEQALVQERSAATTLQMIKAGLYHDLKQAEHDYQTALADNKAAHSNLALYDNPSPDGSVVVRAPESGVITARNVNPGQIVDQTGQTPWQMLTIVNADTVYVDGQVYEKDMTDVKPGERVTVTSDALPSFTASGRVDYVAPGLDPTTHTLSVRADLDNAQGLLKDGMYVTVALDLGASALPTLPVVPMEAVVHDGGSDYVFVAEGNGKYAKRQVALGEQRGEDKVEIVSGLHAGETIVTHGALYLGAGGTADD